ncbi:TIM barrel protein [Actinophytocola gossypii]|uniref:TIM barrel protein n=1 Tax=Actinophytocola gossypii TaxID=2812003 RepID=A0ABT2JEJ8_9PSEU|nr:TIM barrel protein [Actinophytocola gossypii]MCT2585949.1 TIM barrel protein [Actinophytocola gossypii]
MRIAAAPISWGVCEVPGWGRVLDPATVLGEMTDLGITATELGPPGYLPTEPATLRETLAAHRLGLVGGFLAVVLHDPDRQRSTVDEAARQADLLAAAGADVLVLAANTGLHGYDERPPLRPEQWRTLVDTAGMIRDTAVRAGLRTVLHPHVGTQVETAAEVRRFLTDSDLPLCVDTGHLLIGGTDPVELVRRYPDRIGHVHLKDVRADLTDAVRDGRLGYTEAVARGVYVPLGDGDVDVAALLKLLRDNDYQGWYVLEQDTALPEDPGADVEAVPRRDTARSLAFLHSVH